MSQDNIPYAESMDNRSPNGVPPPTESPPAETPRTSRDAGQRVDEGKGRVFPCERCGADLTFNIGTQSLKCPYCGHEQQLQPTEAQIVEQDFEAMLKKLQEWRSAGTEQQQTSEVRCESCGANVVFTGTLTSSECPYCSSPIQRENIHTSPQRVPVDGVLPFAIDERKASENIGRWVQSLWFAPNEFRKKGLSDKIAGVYLPYWTFDSMTFSRFSGQRGDYYYVTVGTGNQQRQERRTRWTPVAGEFQRFFDDVVVLAGKHLPNWIAVGLEPWPLHRCVPFTPEVLAGFLAQTYDVPLDEGFAQGKERMDAAIAADVRARIGGDEQQVASLKSWYSAITYKHLILPVWLMAYRYHEKVYQVAVNAGTGEVQGERPYSAWKIAGAVVLGIVVAIAIGVIVNATKKG